MASERARYADAGDALRRALVTATKEQLRQSDWRVLGALISEISSYSRVDDDVYVARIAKVANVGESTVRRSLKRLHELGVIVYDSRRGPGRPGRITIGVTAHLGEQSESAQHGEQSVEVSPLKIAASDRSTWRATTEKVREEIVDDDLDQLFDDITFGPTQRAHCRTLDPKFVAAWIEHGLTSNGNPPAIAYAGITTGEWPPTNRPAADPCDAALRRATQLARNWAHLPYDELRADLRAELEHPNFGLMAGDIDRILFTVLDATEPLLT